MSKLLFAFGLLALAAPVLSQNMDFTQRFPVGTSQNGHVLTDRQNKPFFYQADTPWLLFYIWTKQEVDQYLKARKAQGFSVIQVQLLTDQFTMTNTDGLHPLNGSLDLASRNERFFEHVDWCIRKAADHGLAVMIAPVWLACCVPGWHKGLKENGAVKAREFGRFLGRRYAHQAFPNVLGWIHGGDSNPDNEFDEVQALAEGIQSEENDKGRLHTGHWRSPYSTRDQAPIVAWLNLNATYTYEPGRRDLGLDQYQVYASSLRDYQRLPAQPFFLIESHYETPENDPFATAEKTEVVRRQAWWSILSGSTGFTYGSSNCCGLRQDWRQVLDLPVASQMRFINDLWTHLPWYKLVPDGLPDPLNAANHRFIVDGFGTFYPYPGPSADMGNDYIVAAATHDKTLLVAYLPPTGVKPRTFTIDLGGFAHTARARWMNPVTGKFTPLTGLTAGRQQVTSPGQNGSGQNDWVLIVE